MWRNKAWQDDFLNKAKIKFNLRDEQIQQALLIKSFNQAYFWGGSPELARRQIEHFIFALDLDHIS